MPSKTVEKTSYAQALILKIWLVVLVGALESWEYPGQ
jgi:hypothetical protein